MILQSFTQKDLKTSFQSNTKKVQKAYGFLRQFSDRDWYIIPSKQRLLIPKMAFYALGKAGSPKRSVN